MQDTVLRRFEARAGNTGRKSSEPISVVNRICSISFRLCSRFRFWLTAPPGRYRRSVWTSLGMPQECANLIRSLGRKNVLELASLLFNLSFTVHCQTVGEQPLRKPVPANDVCRALPPFCREIDNHA